MMPGHWHASSARRRHPQAILETGLITRRLTWYFGQSVGFDAGCDQPPSTGGAFCRLIARFARARESWSPVDMRRLRLCPMSGESNWSNQRSDAEYEGSKRALWRRQSL